MERDLTNGVAGQQRDGDPGLPATGEQGTGEIMPPVSTSGGEDLPDVLTVEEVAGLLRVNPKTVREHFNAGLLPGQRIGQKIIRFHRGAVLEWLRGQRRDARSSRRTR